MADPSQLLVTATFDALYASTIISLRLESSNPFTVRLSGSLLRLKTGHIDSDSYRSEEETSDRQALEVELMDWVVERAVHDEHSQGAQNHYGISFYPFISSFLRGSVAVISKDPDRPFRLMLDVPDTFRPLYKQATVRFGGVVASEPRHAQGTERSRFIFAGKEPSADLECNVAFRLSAARLAELVTYPTAYYVLSLTGIAVAARVATPGVVVAAVGALWTFMLREWSVAKVPRRHTILSAIYLFAGAVAAAWATLWECLGWWGLAGIPILATLVLSFAYARGEVRCRRHSSSLSKSTLVVARGTSLSRLEAAILKNRSG